MNKLRPTRLARLAERQRQRQRVAHHRQHVHAERAQQMELTRSLIR